MLGLVAGLDIKLPEPGTKAEEKDEWVIVLGGSGSVGALAVQVMQSSPLSVVRSILTFLLIDRSSSRIQSPRLRLACEVVGKSFQQSLS